jgi:hypothetical protein
MNFTVPGDWDNQSNSTSKKRKAGESTIKPAAAAAAKTSSSARKPPPPNPLPVPLPPSDPSETERSVEKEAQLTETLSPIVTDILSNIHKTQQNPCIPAEMDLDVILTHVSFSDILKNFFHRYSIDETPSIPVISKIYEESFMREPQEGERPCASGSLCECNFINPELPFTAVEFLLPGEGVPKTPQFCVLCSRKITQKCFYDILFSGKEFKTPIQRFGNLCNTPKEYARECVLICPPQLSLQCMPFPMMSHQRNKYEVHTLNGQFYLKQIQVSYEDFHAPLTKE